MSDAALKYETFDNKDDSFFKIEDRIINEYKDLKDKCDSIIDKIKQRKVKNGE